MEVQKPRSEDFADGRLADTTILADRLDGGIETPAPFLLGSRNKEFPFFRWLDDVQVYNRELSG